MRFLNNPNRPIATKSCLIITKLVQRLAIWCLVPAEPLTNTTDHTFHVLVNVCHIVELWCQRIISGNSKHLPVKLTVVNHGKSTQNLDTHHLTLGMCPAADFYYVHRIVIAKHLQLWVFHSRILPSLRKIAVIPKYGAMIVTELALLLILCNGVGRFLGCDLHLCLCHFGNFGYHPVLSLASILRTERHIVPWRDLVALCSQKVAPERFRAFVATRFRADVRRCSTFSCNMLQSPCRDHSTVAPCCEGRQHLTVRDSKERTGDYKQKPGKTLMLLMSMLPSCQSPHLP
mmetsp:Transcript_32021/g.63084  ORF Transcript_32021/g.63084 Transcript_32021/m.63084 type:complete len:288 (-) Transcript_32021:52-915(-)